MRSAESATLPSILVARRIGGISALGAIVVGSCHSRAVCSGTDGGSTDASAHIGSSISPAPIGSSIHATGTHAAGTRATSMDTTSVDTAGPGTTARATASRRCLSGNTCDTDENCCSDGRDCSI